MEVIMRIIFTGGGTAGHIHPAIAIADRLMKMDKKCEILFIGRKDGKENGIIRERGYKLKEIDVEGLKRKVTPKNLKVIQKAISGRKSAAEIIKDFEPDIVFGTGGYVSLPVLSAARSLKIKTAIHESNAYAGLTTRIAARGCELVFLGFGEAKKKIKSKGKILVSGNPVREDFYKLNRASARRILGLKDNEKLIVSFGGSLGAEKINDTVCKCMQDNELGKENLMHLHAVGRASYDIYKSKYPELAENKARIKIVDYINDTPLYLLAADLAITRSGAITVSELKVAATPSILIPSPNVTANHQLKNAKVLERTDGATVIEEKDLNPKLLSEKIEKCLNETKNKLNRKTPPRLTPTDAICLELIKSVET